MTCASRLIECPHCAATGCRNANCGNLVLAGGKCTKCGERVKKAKPLGRVCKQTIEPKAEIVPTPRTSAAIAAAHTFELPPPRPTVRPVPPVAEPAPRPAVRRQRSSWLAGTGLLAVLLALGGVASRPVYRPRADAGGSAGAIFVDAMVLASRFGRDATQADNLFKGRAITLSARVGSVGDDTLTAGTVRCVLGRRTTPQERAILPGTMITLRGVVSGAAERGHVDLNACELLPQLD
jgi:hypothetical protein